MSEARYDPPPIPAVGDRVHRIGPFPKPGEVRAVMAEAVNPDGSPYHIIVVRWWLKHKRWYHWECVDEGEWKVGLVRPGPVPNRREDGHWPWETST